MSEPVSAAHVARNTPSDLSQPRNAWTQTPGFVLATLTGVTAVIAGLLALNLTAGA